MTSPSTTTRPADSGRPKRAQAVLSVQSKTRISPRLLRVRLGGEQLSALHRNEHSDAYVKLLLCDPSSGLEPPYDLESLRQEAPDLLPARRTYSVRRWDDEAGAIDVDFVLHGDSAEDAGVAARWADEALPGDRIAVMGAGGGYTPRADAGEHLLIGDHAALPAIAASLEAMPADARGHVLIHLEHEEDAIELPHAQSLDVRYVIGSREDLLEAVYALELAAPEEMDVFCHAERGLTKILRRHLVTERRIPRQQISISAYWALGRVEDQFQAEKREPIGAIE